MFFSCLDREYAYTIEYDPPPLSLYMCVLSLYQLRSCVVGLKLGLL